MPTFGRSQLQGLRNNSLPGAPNKESKLQRHPETRFFVFAIKGTDEIFEPVWLADIDILRFPQTQVF